MSARAATMESSPQAPALGNRIAEGVPDTDRLSAARGSQAGPTDACTEAAGHDGPASSLPTHSRR
jgi:hypothetical protein